nr:WYL domain-containing protein [Longispora sp. (in: high G+C Gram-positive bacteria)]
RTLAKIEAVAQTERIAVEMPDQSERIAQVRQALERGRAARMIYYTARRDVTSERVIDPMRLLFAEGRTYVEAWCRTAGGVRLFRTDRIDALTELDEPSAPPPWARSTDVEQGVFQPSPELPLITLRVGRQARWVTEYYPYESVSPEPGGDWIVTLRAADLEWARRLLLRLGGGATALAPPELVSSVNESARAALLAYDRD